MSTVHYNREEILYLTEPDLCVVYCLELEDDCWYVGMSTRFNQRMAQHFSAEGGSVWTRLHKPKRIAEVIFGRDEVEDAMTREYKHRYGIEPVRGGRWRTEGCDHGLEVLDGYIPGSVYELSEAYVRDFRASLLLTE